MEGRKKKKNKEGRKTGSNGKKEGRRKLRKGRETSGHGGMG